MELELKGRGARASLSGFAESALAGLLILITLILFSPVNTPILARDEGVFVYIGRGILAGKLPYRDLWDHKGPLIYYLNALGLWLGQDSLWGIWLVEAILVGLSLALLYRLLRRELSPGAAMFALLTWIAGFTIVMGGNIVEEYAIPVSMLSLAIALGRGPRAGLWLGLLTGFGFMLRPNEIAGPVAGLAFVLLDRARTISTKAAFRSALQFVGGFLIIAVGVACYFAWNGALSDFASAVFLFNLLYVSKGGNVLSSLLAGSGYLAVPVLFGIAGVLVASFGGRRLLSPERHRLFFFAVGLLLLVIPLSLLSGRVYRHYYIPWLLPLSILAGFLCFGLRQAGSRPQLRNLLWALSWFVLIIATLIGMRIRAVPLLAGEPPQAEAQAVQSMRALSPAHSPLFMWGDETSYAVMAGRTLAGRYIYASPVLTPGFGERAADQVLQDLAVSRPLIIDAAGAEGAASSLSGPAPYPYLAGLYSFIHDNYQIAGTIFGKNWVVWAPK